MRRTLSAPTVGAIPTTYAGVEFRSRLEARWAFVFDLLGLRWQYEPEAYTDGSISYLPDFWLPDLDLFWEVKPNWDFDDRKIVMLNAVTGRDAAVAVGGPTDALCDPPAVWGRDFSYYPDYWTNPGDLLACPRDVALQAASVSETVRFWEPDGSLLRRPQALIVRPPQVVHVGDDRHTRLAQKWLWALPANRQRPICRVEASKGTLFLTFWNDDPPWVATELGAEMEDGDWFSFVVERR